MSRDVSARAREGRATKTPSHHFGEHDVLRDRAAEENEKRLQQLEDAQPDPTYANRGSE